MSTSSKVASSFVVALQKEIVYSAETRREADAYVDSYKGCFDTEELNGALPVARLRKRGAK